MNKDTFQRYALVTIVVLLGAIASQKVMAYAQDAFRDKHDHEVVVRNVDVEVFIDEQRELADEARALAFEARDMAEEGIRMHNGVCDLSEEAHEFAAEARRLGENIRLEIR